MKRLLILLCLFILPTVCPALTVEEGSTAFWVVDFYDEDGNLVQPDYIAFEVTSHTNIATQTVQECEHGGLCSTYYGGASDTASSMTLTLSPSANQIINSNTASPESRKPSLWFRYPIDCIDGGTDDSTSATPACKYGVGDDVYYVKDIRGVCVDTSAESGYGQLQEIPCP